MISLAVVRRRPFRAYGVAGMIGLGALYGLVLEVVAAGVVLPVWAAEPPVPFPLPMGVVTHLVYGVLLGAVVGITTSRGGSSPRPWERADRPVA